MTNEIAIDMDRLSVQVMKREKRILGAAANEKGYRSVGDYVRHLIEAGLEIEDRPLAEKYKAARAMRYAQAVSLCFIGSLIVYQSLIGSIDLRRALRPTRRVEDFAEVVA